MTLTLEKKVNLLWDKLAISELMNAFGRSLDLHDWALYRQCFLDEFEVDFQRLTGFAPVRVRADLWTRFAELALAPLTVHHQYSNFTAKIAGDTAHATIYMVARHHSPTDLRWNTQYGWYENDFVRTDDGFGWKISKLRHDFQWIAGAPDLIDMSNPNTVRVVREIFS